MSEKTEEPTPKRLQQSRDRGEVALSRDAVSAIALLGALLGAPLSIRHIHTSFNALQSHAVEAARTNALPSFTSILAHALSEVLACSAPMLGGAFGLAVVCAAVQTRFLIAPEAALPKLDRLNVFGALGKYAKPRTYVEPIIQLLKGALVFWAGTSLVWTLFLEGTLRTRTLTAIPTSMAESLSRVAWRMVGIALVFAILDVLYRQLQHIRDLRMTHEEVKREHKESEGDGQLKAARERLHHELLQEATMAAVQRASFVVTNPTHYAVALRYEHEETEAPEILAKGVGATARRIIEEAQRAGVPVLRDAPLARTLHELDIGEQIPEELYEAVAAIVNHLSNGGAPEAFEAP